MAQADFGTGKSLVVLAIVLGCFAVLWPKIFYPMMQTAFAMTSPKVDSDGRFQDNDRPPHLHPASMGPRGRGPPSDDVQDKFLMREGRPFPHPQARQPVKSQPKSGGAMSIIMPIYTVGIVVFFLYTVLKLVFKKPNEGDKKPLIKDFHMDPEYRKFVCQQSNESARTSKTEEQTKKTLPNLSEATIPEDEEITTKDLDPKDYEIFKLKKKLEETEQAMERIIKHMGVVNACLTEKAQLIDKSIEQKIIHSQNFDVRQRHTNKVEKQADSSLTSKRCHVQDIDDEYDMKCSNVTKLEEDLTELINLCNATDQACCETKDEDADCMMEEEEEIEITDDSNNDSDVDAGEDLEQNDLDGKDQFFSINGCCKNMSCA
ncbi:RIC3 domain-containing protein [Nephila pilipes]|uniref:RIC3 domain-containing protein n=1 Tax=Nephila pilipes TaxID=299642 RepID=A0A8X6QEC9_NEPPI|nr:RIC3 domain-containing protein [Nephila pilipes]